MKYLIIGASSGLGRELAKKFAEENNNLVLVSRDERDLNAIKSDLEIKYNININILTLDFSSIDEINQKLLSQNNIIENLDGVIFPIGMMFSEDNLNLDNERMNKLVNANFLSIAYVIQKIKTFLLKKKIFSKLDLGQFMVFYVDVLTRIILGRKDL